jgi:hypothetical protein
VSPTTPLLPPLFPELAIAIVLNIAVHINAAPAIRAMTRNELALCLNIFFIT